MGQKSLFFAYLLWLFFGWLGLHHFYLGRDVHAFICCSTFGGMFGLGLLHDLWRMPDYVDDANEEASYIERFKQKVKRGTPQFNVSRFVGQILVGYFYGILVRNAIPEHLRWISGLIEPFGVAVGVYLVGNVGRETGGLEIPLFVCYTSNFVMANLMSKKEPEIMYIALFGAIAFQNCRKFRLERRQKRGICKRFFMLCLGGCLVTGLWISFFYHNAYVTQNGESIKLRDEFIRFLNSPLWKEWQEKGWGDNFVKAFDPTGEQNALKVLNLSQNAGQEEIKKRYKQLAREWHPDKYRGDKEKAQKRFMKIQEAYEILSIIKAKTKSKNQKKRL